MTVLLVGATVVAVATYRELPCTRDPRSPRPRPRRAVVDARAARVKALTGELEAMLQTVVAAELRAGCRRIEERLARLRHDGATARPTGSRRGRRARSSRSRRASSTAATSTRASRTTRSRSAVDPGAQGGSQLAATLRERAEAALRADHAADAVRWARTVVGLAEADPDAHALLAEALLAAHDDAGAADEFGKALASRPTDAAFKRGLARARKHPAHPSPRSRAKPVATASAPPAAAAVDEQAATGEKKDEAKEEPKAKDEVKDEAQPAAKAEPKSESKSESKSARAAGSAAGEPAAE